MALILADRVKDTTTTAGTGTITLSGTAPTGFQNFSVIGDGNTTYYTIAGQSTSEWEVGIGTYTSSGTTLSRTTVLASSNSGSLVVFSAGTKDVFVTYPAERSVNLSSAALTSGRVPYATTDGLLVDASTLTFNGTTFTAGVPTVISMSSSSDALRITQTGAGNALVVEDSANPDATPFVIDASGRVVIGTTAAQTMAATTPIFQLHAAGGSMQEALVSWGTSSTNRGDLQFLRSASGVIGTQGIVASGYDLGALNFYGDDGTAFIQAAQILAEVDGTPGTNDMPGRLVFSTTANGASTPTERMRIDSAGGVGIGSTSSTATKLNIAGSLTGATAGYGVLIQPTIQPDVTANVYLSRSQMSTAANGGTPYTIAASYDYIATQGTFNADSTVTTQSGFGVASALTGATNNYGFLGSIASGTGRWNLYMNGTADNYLAGNLGIGSTSLTARRLVVAGSMTGATGAYGLFVAPTVQPDVTSIAYINSSQAATAANGGTPYTISNIYVFNASQGTFNADSTVTNQYGFNVTSSLTGATNNYGFYGNIASSTGRWNLYMSGTAQNYILGNVGIGSGKTTPAYAVDVTGTVAASTSVITPSVTNAGTLALSATSTNIITASTNGSERMRITSAGGVSFGATGTAYGTSGQVLTSAGDAPPTWATPTTPSTPILINTTTVSSNYTISTGTNGLSVGPMTVASGVAVTVATGQRWLVL